MIEADGKQTQYKKQTRGIRQGCPLSPYLFIIIMTALIEDVKQDKKLSRELAENRIKGTVYDEILFADDTVIFSENPQILQKLLRKIETTGELNGLSLNKDKCESLIINPGINDSIKFKNGKKVSAQNEYKYLGCNLNEKGDPNKEIKRRKSEAYQTWRKLELFWKKVIVTSQLSLEHMMQ